jgi:hypothetical protein
MAEPVIYREEVVALQFAVYDVSETLAKIYGLLLGEEDSDEQEEEN